MRTAWVVHELAERTTTKSIALLTRATRGPKGFLPSSRAGYSLDFCRALDLAPPPPRRSPTFIGICSLTPCALSATEEDKNKSCLYQDSNHQRSANRRDRITSLTTEAWRDNNRRDTAIGTCSGVSYHSLEPQGGDTGIPQCSACSSTAAASHGTFRPPIREVVFRGGTGFHSPKCRREALSNRVVA